MIDNIETNMRHRFRLMRLLGNTIIASDCEIECQLMLNIEADIDEAHLRLAGIKMWLEDFVDGSIAYCPDTVMDATWIDYLDNNTIMVPGNEPLDHILTMLFHKKISAISDHTITVKRTQLITDTSHGFSSTVSGSSKDWLPSMTEWIGPRHFHKTPWWYRQDASSIDLQPGPNDDLSIIPDLGMNIIDMLRPDDDDDTPPVEKKAADVVRPKFVPRLVTSDDD